MCKKRKICTSAKTWHGGQKFRSFSGILPQTWKKEHGSYVLRTEIPPPPAVAGGMVRNAIINLAAADILLCFLIPVPPLSCHSRLAPFRWFLQAKTTGTSNTTNIPYNERAQPNGHAPYSNSTLD